MTFDEDSMEKAYKLLESTEKFCDVGDGMFGQMFKDQSRKAELQNMPPHEKLYRKCVIADCLLFEAILAFLKQGITGYVKGGFILRKAWKLYVKVYQETEQLCTTLSPFTPGSSPPADDYPDGTNDGKVENGVATENGKDGNSTDDPDSKELEKLSLEELPIGAAPTNSSDSGTDATDSNGMADETDDMCKAPILTQPVVSNVCESIPWDDDNYVFPTSVTELQDQDTRLRAAVYFGYGVMNLCISLIPPKLLKVANLLGFRGDRQFGLRAMKYVSCSQDIKAPLAR